MRKLVAAMAVVSLLTFSATVMAEEEHPASSSVQKGHTEQTPSESHEGSTGHGEMPNMTPEDHQNMPSDQTKDMMPEMSPEEHQNIPSETSSEGHGGEHGGGPVVEAPPNYKALGAFGAINAGFILIGIWNKWFRRKETGACQA